MSAVMMSTLAVNLRKPIDGYVKIDKDSMIKMDKDSMIKNQICLIFMSSKWAEYLSS